MITLHQLQWNNCFSYADNNSIQLDSYPITQLIGSNGAGKTSIPLMVQEVLYGKNTKGIKKQNIINRNTDKKGYYIKLTFSVDSDKYEVELDRKSTLKLKLIKNGEDISSHTSINTYKNIADILGVPDFKTFAQLIYQSSTQSLEFLTATDTNRKKFLISLLHLEKYVELHELFKKKSKELNDVIKEVTGAANNLESWIVKHEKIDQSLKHLKDVPSIDDNLIDKLTSLKGEINNIKEINKKIQANNTYKKMLEVLDLDILVETVELPTNIVDVEHQKSEISGKIRSPELLIKKIEGLGDKCPTCLQNIEPEHKDSLLAEYRNEINELKALDKTLSAQLQNLKSDKVKYDERKKVQQDFERLHLLIDESIPNETLNKVELERELEELSKTVNNLNTLISKISKENSEASSHNSKVKLIIEQLGEFRSQLTEKRLELLNLDTQSHVIELLKSTFSTNGLISYKIESSVKELEKVINEYLSEFSHFQIFFKLSGDKLNIEVLDSSGNSTGIENLSAGEEARVNISTVLAIRKIMSSLTSTKINFLFLDEIVGVLDDDGRERLAEILMEENLNTFIVSHGWVHPLIPKLLVIKEKKISRIIENG